MTAKKQWSIKSFISARLPLILQDVVKPILPDEGARVDVEELQDFIPNWHLQWGLRQVEFVVGDSQQQWTHPRTTTTIRPHSSRICHLSFDNLRSHSPPPAPSVATWSRHLPSAPQLHQPQHQDSMTCSQHAIPKVTCPLRSIKCPVSQETTGPRLAVEDAPQLIVPQ